MVFKFRTCTATEKKLAVVYFIIFLELLSFHMYFCCNGTGLYLY